MLKMTNFKKITAYILLILSITVFSGGSRAGASDYTEVSGDMLAVLIPAIAYSTTFYLDDSEGRGQFCKSFVANLGVSYGLKYTVKKERPNGGEHSFPSFHTSSAFQGASFIHKRYGWKYSIPSYIGAAFVGYSRVAADKHYVEDVVAGAVIGAASSFYFTTKYGEISVSPVVSGDFYGLGLSKRW